eukprot:TRINITY_DN745_c0_g1_i1.p3 TRINITY_DN745_c0_g1~~TRINITY_DN745_c0_g1_i1.p3  ORF type:complete len:137 (+),score=24.52 TRINITY_DN745_c0_g1_i1:59-412(+)
MKMLNRNRKERITAEQALKLIYNWFEKSGKKEVKLKRLLAEKDLELKKVWNNYQICKKEWEEDKKVYQGHMKKMEALKKENELKHACNISVNNYGFYRERRKGEQYSKKQQILQNGG